MFKLHVRGRRVCRKTKGVRGKRTFYNLHVRGKGGIWYNVHVGEGEAILHHLHVIEGEGILY